jgi:hypothetical protein
MTFHNDDLHKQTLCRLLLGWLPGSCIEPLHTTVFNHSDALPFFLSGWVQACLHLENSLDMLFHARVYTHTYAPYTQHVHVCDPELYALAQPY